MQWQQYTNKIVYIRTYDEMERLLPEGQPMLNTDIGAIQVGWNDRFSFVALPDGKVVHRSVSFCTHCGAVITHNYCDCEEAQSKLGNQRYGPEFRETCAAARKERIEPSTEREFIGYMCRIPYRKTVSLGG